MTRSGFGKFLVTSVLTGVFTAPSLGAMTIKVHDSYGDAPGGEFIVTPISGWSVTPDRLNDSNAYFETFCLEKNEHFSFGPTYTVVLNTEALLGGVGGQVGLGDPLSAETAYLYRQFIDGDLASYDYGTGTGRVDSATALQDVIWYLEDEHAKSWTDGDNSLQDLFYQDALANAGNDLHGVAVMNLYYTGNGQREFRQDMLVATSAVPLPASALLGLLGFGFTSRFRRRTK